jgi:hypothetical protein
MNATDNTGTPTKRSSQRPTIVLMATVILLAGGLAGWNVFLRVVRYEIDLDRTQLFTGTVDTVRVSAFGVNGRGGRVPFSSPAIRAEIVEGAQHGRLVEAGTSVLFVSSGMGEGEVLLRVFVEGWPFPMMVPIRIAAPVAMRHMAPSIPAPQRRTPPLLSTQAVVHARVAQPLFGQRSEMHSGIGHPTTSRRNAA